jgi:MarR family transcriptional regulator, lower aerobic nicotinate degradation pathway regulator
MLNRMRPGLAPRQVVNKTGRYVLDLQVGFLLRVAMQRHTAIFMWRMQAGLTQTQFAALATRLARVPRIISAGSFTWMPPRSRGSIGGAHPVWSRPAAIQTIAPDAAIALTDTGRQTTVAAVAAAADITAATLEPLTIKDGPYHRATA